MRTEYTTKLRAAEGHIEQAMKSINDARRTSPDKELDRMMNQLDDIVYFLDVLIYEGGQDGTDKI